MSDLVPVLTLSEIYSPFVRARELLRWQELESRFEKMYHNKPAFIARAPGRVNMIGECVFFAHLDTSIPRATVCFL